jgi:hypothetical protein
MKLLLIHVNSVDNVPVLAPPLGEAVHPAPSLPLNFISAWEESAEAVRGAGRCKPPCCPRDVRSPLLLNISQMDTALLTGSNATPCLPDSAIPSRANAGKAAAVPNARAGDCDLLLEGCTAYIASAPAATGQATAAAGAASRAFDSCDNVLALSSAA